jgi:hypothetical protein
MALWGNVDQAADKPKYLNTADTAAVEGISAAEAATPGNKAKGVQHPGWVLYRTYTDAQGSTRHKTETLVAMGSMTSDDNTDDSTVGIDPVITIGTQPANASVTSPASATFTVVSTINNGGALSYQWQVSPNGTAWANITGATAATLTVDDTDAEYVTGNFFRVVVSATGATTVNSSSVTLTIA